MVGLLFVVLLLISIGFFWLIYWGIKSAKKEEELEHDIEAERRAREFQEQYAQISSRPDFDADDIIQRMRKSNDNSSE